MAHKDILMTLTTSERVLLKFFEASRISEAYESDIAKALGRDLAEVSRAALWLSNKGLAKRIQETRTQYVLTEKGKKYVDDELPEAKLLKLLKGLNGKASMSLLLSKMPKEELNIAIGNLARKRILRISKSDGERIIELVKDIDPDSLPSVEAFRAIAKGEPVKEDDEGLQELIRRGLVRAEKVTRWKVVLTDLGKQIVSAGIPEVEVIERVTPEVIASREWERKPIRWYDVTAPVPKTWGGRKHPLRAIMEKIRRIFLEMGFREMRGPWVELAFWNMDGMWIPQDHPARELQATFYLSRPSKGFVEDRELVALVKEVQETGGDTGSLGWRQPWSEEVAMKTLLRTHTTAVTFRVLGFLLRTGKIKPPVKFFCIGRVFRNETIDWKHLAEFHQVEGFVVAEGLTLRSLMGYISEFYRKMGIEKLRFKPTYNPYTEPSMEIFAWHEKAGKWIEVGNSGLFRPETLRPYGITVPVIAWGLAVERLAAIIYGIDDIRKLIGPMCDINWIRWYKAPIRLF